MNTYLYITNKEEYIKNGNVFIYADDHAKDLIKVAEYKGDNFMGWYFDSAWHKYGETIQRKWSTLTHHFPHKTLEDLNKAFDIIHNNLQQTYKEHLDSI